MTLPDQLSSLSHWTRCFLRDAPFRPREETITEVLLTELTRGGGRGARVRKSSTAEEARDGLDWAWAIRTPAGWVHLLVQAKQASGIRSAVYLGLRKPKAAVQATNIIHAAAIVDAVPVYVFFNPEVHPFGGDHMPVTFGACSNGHRLRRGLSLPWSPSHESPGAVSVAHAQDVLDHVITAPAARQHATNANRYAMPWECLLCPKVGRASGGTSASPPIINSVAVTIRRCVDLELERASGADEDVPAVQSTVRGQQPRWMTPEPPTWAQLLLSGGDPEADDDAPSVGYYVVLDAPDEN